MWPIVKKDIGKTDLEIGHDFTLSASVNERKVTHVKTNTNRVLQDSKPAFINDREVALANTHTNRVLQDSNDWKCYLI